MVLLLLPAPLQPRLHPGVGTLSFRPQRWGFHLARNHPQEQLRSSFPSLLEASPQQSRCTRQHGLHYRHHSMQATTATHTEGGVGSASCAMGLPSPQGSPSAALAPVPKGLFGGLVPPPWNWETLGNGGIKASSAPQLHGLFLPGAGTVGWSPRLCAPSWAQDLCTIRRLGAGRPIGPCLWQCGSRLELGALVQVAGSCPWPSGGTSGLEPGRVVLVYHCPTGPEWWPWAPCALQDEADCSPLALPEPRLQAQAPCAPPASLALPPPTANHRETPVLPFAQSPANCDRGQGAGKPLLFPCRDKALG